MRGGPSEPSIALQMSLADQTTVLGLWSSLLALRSSDDIADEVARALVASMENLDTVSLFVFDSEDHLREVGRAGLSAPNPQRDALVQQAALMGMPLNIPPANTPDGCSQLLIPVFQPERADDDEYSETLTRKPGTVIAVIVIVRPPDTVSIAQPTRSALRKSNSQGRSASGLWETRRTSQLTQAADGRLSGVNEGRRSRPTDRPQRDDLRRSSFESCASSDSDMRLGDRLGRPSAGLRRSRTHSGEMASGSSPATEPQDLSFDSEGEPSGSGGTAVRVWPGVSPSKLASKLAAWAGKQSAASVHPEPPPGAAGGRLAPGVRAPSNSLTPGMAASPLEPTRGVTAGRAPPSWSGGVLEQAGAAPSPAAASPAAGSPAAR